MEVKVKDFEDIAAKFKLMSHPVRLCILTGLLKKGECNVSFMQGCLESPQSTISQHLQKLKSAGLVSCRREGVEIYYKVADKDVVDIITFMFKDVL